MWGPWAPACCGRSEIWGWPQYMPYIATHMQKFVYLADTRVFAQCDIQLTIQLLFVMVNISASDSRTKTIL